MQTIALPKNEGVLDIDFEIDGITRWARIFLPTHIRLHPETHSRVGVIACDGVTRGIPNRMPKQYRMDATADRCGFIAIYPEPLTRELRITGWNTPGGLLTYRHHYDDARFIWELKEYLKKKLGIEHLYGAGFSSGAQFMHVLSGKFPGIFKGVISAGGTVYGTELPPAPGTDLIVFHGRKDLRLPYEHRLLLRGMSRGLVKGVETFYAAGWKSLRSQPPKQISHYAKVNPGALAEPIIETGSCFERRQFSDGSPILLEFMLDKPCAGHDWHIVDGVFDTNQTFTHELGLDALV